MTILFRLNEYPFAVYVDQAIVVADTESPWSPQLKQPFSPSKWECESKMAYHVIIIGSLSCNDGCGSANARWK